MRTRSVTRSLMIILATGTAVHAAGPATTQSADPAVTALIAQLDADDGQARDAAAAKLVELGEPIRPAMVDAAEHAASLEVRSRAAGVIAKLNRIAPTTVTLRMKDADARAVLAAVSRQAGVSIHTWLPGEGHGKVTVDWVALPFWPALADVCRQAGGQVFEGPLDGQLAVVNASRHNPLDWPRFTAGRTAVVVGPYTHYRLSRPREGQPMDRYTVTALALLDPKDPVVRNSAQMTLTEATDDKGASVLSGENDGVEELGPLLSVGFGLRPPSPGATRIKRLAGELTATLADPSERLVIDDIVRAGHEPRTAGAFTAELTAASVGDRSASYALTIHGPSGQQRASPLDIRLIDADGNRLCDGDPMVNGDPKFEWAPSGITHAHADIHVRWPIREPVRLIWQPLGRTRSLSVPFEFHDLPLQERE